MCRSSYLLDIYSRRTGEFVIFVIFCMLPLFFQDALSTDIIERRDDLFLLMAPLIVATTAARTAAETRPSASESKPTFTSTNGVKHEAAMGTTRIGSYTR